MLTEEGKFLITAALFMIAIFAGGYFMGWTRDRLSAKLFDKLFYYIGDATYWRERLEDEIEEKNRLWEIYRELQKYVLEKIGPEHVPTKFGGELE